METEKMKTQLKTSWHEWLWYSVGVCVCTHRWCYEKGDKREWNVIKSIYQLEKGQQKL